VSLVDDAISLEGSTGQVITVRQNRSHDTNAYGVETWQAPGPFTIEDNTFVNSGQGGGVENGGKTTRLLTPAKAEASRAVVSASSAAAA
jgi:hypothetical protein